ncbi:hypothetical protein L1049_002639 [Liquidambar formosana]|uniref:F-box/LRR-repeat protein 15/At3g58940/PEG3-like LRR domain-containing protein n=1 Tax=Liquidambar formosana TaxID=63359 RepID=A0AAP0NG14_LIQFO
MAQTHRARRQADGTSGKKRRGCSVGHTLQRRQGRVTILANELGQPNEDDGHLLTGFEILFPIGGILRLHCACVGDLSAIHLSGRQSPFPSFLSHRSQSPSKILNPDSRKLKERIVDSVISSSINNVKEGFSVIPVLLLRGRNHRRRRRRRRSGGICTSSTPCIDFAPPSLDPRKPVDYNHITETLNLHRTLKIRKFCVVVRLGWTSLPDIKIWVDFAVARAVRCLRIGLVPFTGSYLELPDSLYTCNTQYIEYMFFSCVDFSPPMSGFMGFASLRTLSLFYSKLTDEVVMEIVSKCSLLEDLTIDKCVGLSTVKIVAPNRRLRRFVFRWSFLGEDGIELDVDSPESGVAQVLRKFIKDSFEEVALLG